MVRGTGMGVNPAGSSDVFRTCPAMPPPLATTGQPDGGTSSGPARTIGLVAREPAPARPGHQHTTAEHAWNILPSSAGAAQPRPSRTT
mgnify:CR=1 FL=1